MSQKHLMLNPREMPITSAQRVASNNIECQNLVGEVHAATAGNHGGLNPASAVSGKLFDGGTGQQTLIG